MEKFVLLATAWGSQHGGVNSFNRDFAGGLAEALGQKGQVFCAVLEATKDQIEDAKHLNVDLLSLGGSDEFSSNQIEIAKRLLKERFGAATIDYWIGHDVITGFAAVQASKPSSRAALIMHMDYKSYLAIKHPGRPILERIRKQELLFKNETEAALFAIGPLLNQSCGILSNQKPTMLIPGFPCDLPKSGAREGHLSAITLGRFDDESDRVKNGRLAVISFADAFVKAKERSYAYRNYDRPLLSVIGLESEEEIAEIQALAREKAHRHVNVVGSGFETDRKQLFEMLVRSNLAMMLSWHEGFGLVGWEAIAAEVPLILGENSGLFKLIESLGKDGHGSWKDHVFGVDITGDVRKDQKLISARILEAAATMSERLVKSKSLKGQLVKAFGCSWKDTANNFLKGLQPTKNGGGTDQKIEIALVKFAEREHFAVEAIARQHLHEKTKKHFFLALSKSKRAIEEIYSQLNDKPRRSSPEDQIAELFITLLSKPVDHALALLARAHKSFVGQSRDDVIAAKSIRCSVRAYVEIVFPDSLIETLRPRALADGVFLDLPAQTITGAEIVEAKLQGHTARFAETTLRDADGTTRPGRPRGVYAMPMPPTCGPEQLERFGLMVEDWLRDKLAYPGEKLTANDIRHRLTTRKISGERRYYFVVNAPEWGHSDKFNYNASWYAGYQSALRRCVEDLNRDIPQIAFFTLTETRGDAANEETTTLQSVFSLLQIDEECP